MFGVSSRKKCSTPCWSIYLLLAGIGIAMNTWTKQKNNTPLLAYDVSMILYVYIQPVDQNFYEAIWLELPLPEYQNIRLQAATGQQRCSGCGPHPV
jgi:hypothetical protein